MVPFTDCKDPEVLYLNNNWELHIADHTLFNVGHSHYMPRYETCHCMGDDVMPLGRFVLFTARIKVQFGLLYLLRTGAGSGSLLLRRQGATAQMTQLVFLRVRPV